MEHVVLGNGIRMPMLGFGTYLVEGAGAQGVVEQALEAGYRHLDTAAYYRNEREVGAAVARSGIAREDLFITTKLMVCGYEAGRRAIGESLERLGTYADLFLIHWPQGGDLETWRALEEAARNGEVRAIGLSSFYGREFADIARCAEIPPAVNQCETHPLRQQREAQALFAEHGCVLESWSPFVEGRQGFFGNPVLTQIGSKYGKTVAQVTLRWLVQRGIPAIPKTVHRQRMEENLAVFDFELTEADMARIAELDTGRGQFGW